MKEFSDITALIIVAMAAFLALRSLFIRLKKRTPGNECDCSNCPMSAECGEKAENPGLPVHERHGKSKTHNGFPCRRHADPGGQRQG